MDFRGWGMLKYGLEILRALDSTRQCNRGLIVKYFSWGAKPERLARAMIECVHDPFHFLLGDGREPMVLGEILPDQTVGVLISAPFP